MTSVPPGIGTSRGVACGSAPFSAAATIEGKLGPEAPRARICSSAASATARSVRPTSPQPEQPGVDVVDQRRRGADRVELLRLLDRPLRLDEPAGGDELDPVRERLAQPGVRPHRHLLVLEPEPQLALGPARRERRAQVLRRGLQVEAVELGPGALDVAAVGEEAAQVRPHHRDPVRAGEAGQVAEVDPVRDEQEVEAGVRQPGAHPVRAAHSAAFSCSSPTL